MPRYETGQLSFGFEDIAPPDDDGPSGNDELFYAIFPPHHLWPEITRLAVATKTDRGLKGQLRPEEIYHLTAHWVGYKYPKARSLVRSLATEAGSIVRAESFAMELNRVLSFKHRDQPVVLCSSAEHAEFKRLHEKLTFALRRVGLRPKRLSVNPHLTLMYGRQFVPETKLEMPIRWMVGEFLLINSLRGKTKYEIVDRWPLAG